MLRADHQPEQPQNPTTKKNPKIPSSSPKALRSRHATTNTKTNHIQLPHPWNDSELATTLTTHTSTSSVLKISLLGTLAANPRGCYLPGKINRKFEQSSRKTVKGKSSLGVGTTNGSISVVSRPSQKITTTRNPGGTKALLGGRIENRSLLFGR